MKHKSFRFEAIKNFTNVNKKLTSQYHEVMSNPWHKDRFKWDYFYVKDQYRLMRTWADEFFNSEDWATLESDLVEFGKKYLGCSGITRPWLSFYTSGCYQKIHADVPHGPFAFVYSLTDWKKKKFGGGETILFKESLLDYWNNYEKMSGVELKDLMDKVPAHQNQLLVFDPKIPHGVEEVTHVEDPTQGRIVIHGWFNQAQPSIQGPMASKSVMKSIQNFIQSNEPLFNDYNKLNGYCSLKITLGESAKTELLIHTLKGYKNSEINTFLKELILKSDRFPWISSKNRQKTVVTLPLIFQS